MISTLTRRLLHRNPDIKITVHSESHSSSSSEQSVNSENLEVSPMMHGSPIAGSSLNFSNEIDSIINSTPLNPFLRARKDLTKISFQ